MDILSDKNISAIARLPYRPLDLGALEWRPWLALYEGFQRAYAARYRPQWRPNSLWTASIRSRVRASRD